MKSYVSEDDSNEGPQDAASPPDRTVRIDPDALEHHKVRMGLLSRSPTIEAFDDELGSDAETETDLQEIKAKTMYRMVEDITLPGGSRHKVLFLTNRQARLLVNTPGSIKRVLEAFEIPAPKLLIRFLQSNGGVDWVKSRQNAGKEVHNPYVGDRQEALQAEQKLYHFMNEVLLPLAAETNALLLVTATQGSCMLTAALQQALRLHRSRYGNALPFSVIAVTSDFNLVYNNDNPSARWHEFKDAVSSWRRRHRNILSSFFQDFFQNQHVSWSKYDINPNFANYILCDAINEMNMTNKQMDFGPFSQFSASLVKYLMGIVPCIAVKTGNTNLTDGDESSLGNVIASLESGCPTILVNIRSWPHAQNLSDAKTLYQEFLEKLQGKWDMQDTMAMCLFLQAWETCSANLQEPAHAARKTVARRHDKLDLLPAHAKQRMDMEAALGPVKAELHAEWEDLILWFAEKYTPGEMLHDQIPPEQAEEWCITQQSKRALQTSAMLRHRHLHVADCCDLGQCKRLVRELVRLDRLPKVEEPEAIDLLEEAWSEYDAKNYLAGTYKWYSKVSYVGLLFLSILSVFMSTFQKDVFSFLQEADTRIPVFLVTLIAGAAASFSAIADPTQRWRVLRSNAAFLLSLIWQYRTRTKAFGMINGGEKPLQVLCFHIRQWKEDLAEGTSLLESTMERAYPQSIYKHLRQNHMNQALQDDQDDFYSPVPPAKYVLLRLVPAVAFYQGRIPSVGRRRRFVQICVVLCSLASATLSFLGHTSWIPLVASLYSSLAAWQEFAGLDQKLRRYTEAVQALKNIRTWWNSLTEVERASPECINRLVDSVEEIICHEVGIWASSLSNIEKKLASQSGQDANAQRKKPVDTE